MASCTVDMTRAVSELFRVVVTLLITDLFISRSVIIIFVIGPKAVALITPVNTDKAKASPFPLDFLNIFLGTSISGL